MGLATKELAKTHRLIEKLLEGFNVRNPRFGDIRKTIRRAVAAHAWMQDEILTPAVKSKICLQKCFLKEMEQEHKDIDSLFKLLNAIPVDREGEVNVLLLQIRGILEAHVWKEAGALYPLVEKCVDEKILYELGSQMEQRKDEVRELGKK